MRKIKFLDTTSRAKMAQPRLSVNSLTPPPPPEVFKHFLIDRHKDQFKQPIFL